MSSAKQDMFEKRMIKEDTFIYGFTYKIKHSKEKKQTMQQQVTVFGYRQIFFAPW